MSKTHAVYYDILKSNIIKRKLSKIAKFIKSNFPSPITVVGMGLSGTLVATFIASKINCNLCIIRKSTDTDNHSSRRFEAGEEFSEYIIVDDCISTGKTVDRIKDVLVGKECLGVVLFNNHPVGVLPELLANENVFGFTSTGKVITVFE